MMTLSGKSEETEGNVDCVFKKRGRTSKIVFGGCVKKLRQRVGLLGSVWKEM